MFTKLNYYAYGEIPTHIASLSSHKPIPKFISNNSYKDKANGMLERNAYSLNSSQFDTLKSKYTALKTLSEKNINDNNYLDPLPSFERRYKPQMNNNSSNPLLMHSFALHKYRLRQYSNDSSLTHPSVLKGTQLTKDNYVVSKTKLSSSMSMPVLAVPHYQEKLKQNIYTVNSGNNRVNNRTQTVYTFNKESKELPRCFEVVNEDKMKHIQSELEKQETLMVLSKNKSWITVTPRSKNRRKCLEKIQVKPHEVSRIVPQWMVISNKYIQNRKDDAFKSVDHRSIRNGIIRRELVDRSNVNNNKHNRSIFAIGDYRHHVRSVNEVMKYQEGISVEPKQFFNWEDN
jgi:hypothetical protein